MTLPTITPHLVCEGAAEAMTFYAAAFGAVEEMRMPGPGGKLMHASMRIGDARFMLVDDMPQMGLPGPKALGGSTVTMHLQCEDADAVFARAVAAGATALMPVAEQFWGDRYGQLRDPFGHRWSVATTVRQLTPEQMQENLRQMMAAGGGRSSDC